MALGPEYILRYIKFWYVNHLLFGYLDLRYLRNSCRALTEPFSRDSEGHVRQPGQDVRPVCRTHLKDP